MPHPDWFSTGSVEYGPEYDSVVGPEPTGRTVRLTTRPDGTTVAPVLFIGHERGGGDPVAFPLTPEAATAVLEQSPDDAVAARRHLLP